MREVNVIIHENGVYTIETPGFMTTGKSAEDVIIRAATNAGISDPEIRSAFDMGELFEQLLYSGVSS